MSDRLRSAANECVARIISCINSSACVYGLTALAVGIYSIPLLFVLWLVIKAPIRSRGTVVFLGLLGMIFFINWGADLIDPHAIMGVIYVLAGVR